MKSLPLWLRLPLIVLLLSGSTALHIVPLLLAALAKAALPASAARRRLDAALMAIAESWIGFNSRMIDACTRTRVVVECDVQLQSDGHYLVLTNHQSWVDIPVLQKVFNRRIPLLRFFLKKQLFWVPLLGLAWWALDFPFMHRHTKEQIARRPELAGRDIAATKRACERFRDIPVAVMNFVEGTRFTPAKHARQGSPYTHLLKPKVGGVAFVLNAMGEAMHAILDVTIAYPDGRPRLMDLLCDRIGEVRVHVRQRSIPAEMVSGDYEGDRAFRVRAQRWMNGLWEEKDAQLASMLTAADPSTGSTARDASLPPH